MVKVRSAQDVGKSLHLTTILLLLLLLHVQLKLKSGRSIHRV